MYNPQDQRWLCSDANYCLYKKCEVIQCRDCKYGLSSLEGFWCKYFASDNGEPRFLGKDKNAFCKWGERRVDIDTWKNNLVQ